MKTVLSLIRKDYLIDFRQKYPILGIVLYITATIFITYLSFNNTINVVTWNSLFWIILLFSSVTSIAKSFVQEEDRSLYYYFLSSSNALLLAKFLYQTIYQLLLVIITILLFSLLLGNPVNDHSLFIINLIVGSLGFGFAFTMISSLSAKTKNQSTMMAILGFPVVIPIILLAVTNSKKVILGASFTDIQGNFFTLISINVIIIAISFVLFPYSRRN